MGQVFTEAERAEVWDRWQGGESMRSIARRLGRPASTVSRELGRNGVLAAVGHTWRIEPQGVVLVDRSAASWQQTRGWRCW
jgi:hypothetical protein